MNVHRLLFFCFWLLFSAARIASHAEEPAADSPPVKVLGELQEAGRAVPAFSPNGEFLGVSTQAKQYVWRVDDNSPAKVLDLPGELGFSQDSKRFFVWQVRTTGSFMANAEVGPLDLSEFDATTVKLIKRWELPFPPRMVSDFPQYRTAFSSSGPRLAAAYVTVDKADRADWRIAVFGTGEK
ncbi:YncE family protein [Lignipirellula cremea]|uniref:WD40-like Beta Propeller Repeat protein n=1 Tax=Lignipirellula cremea TaxID=2528010 RepID=A0A518DM85_9BACT|nr:hypothetical protein [Lignipirellula cremea]QDU92949.1 hypothetical protein Pla8534_07220 [Lignipirellula cremea]